MSAVEMIPGADRAPARLLLRDVRAIDPRSGIDERLDVRVRDGLTAELGAPGRSPATDGEELLEGSGRLALVPAFFDPHVHLRTPGPGAQGGHRHAAPAPRPPAASRA